MYSTTLCAVQYTSAQGLGGGQALDSAGSCLPQYRVRPFVECAAASAQCYYHENKLAFWLAALSASASTAGSTADSNAAWEINGTAAAGAGDAERVGRCRVCLFVGDPEPAPAAAAAGSSSPMSRAAPEELFPEEVVAPPSSRSANELPASMDTSESAAPQQNAIATEDTGFLHWLFGGGLF